MNVYLIAPLPDFGSASLVSEQTQQLGERYTSMTAAGIATVAAYFVEGFQLRLCDEAIEEVDFDDPSDIICISMNIA